VDNSVSNLSHHEANNLTVRSNDCPASDAGNGRVNSCLGRSVDKSVNKRSSKPVYKIIKSYKKIFIITFLNVRCSRSPGR